MSSALDMYRTHRGLLVSEQYAALPPIFSNVNGHRGRPVFTDGACLLNIHFLYFSYQLVRRIRVLADNCFCVCTVYWNMTHIATTRMRIGTIHVVAVTKYDSNVCYNGNRCNS